MTRRSRAFLAALALLAGCAVQRADRAPAGPMLTAQQGRERVAGKLPAKIADRAAWAADIYAAMVALDVQPTADNICATVAVIEQESGFQADPVVPNLSTLAWKEIDTQRERAGIPKLVLQAALSVSSSNGKSYKERIDAARTEGELSAVYEDLVERVPLGPKLLADRNPVRTAGSMQVSVAYAERHAVSRSYPYPVQGTLRRELFTRRGGVYFGIAHLLDYPAPYDSYVYRFADFNAGHYASRNAGFQKALSDLSGIALQLDGDLVRYEKGRVAQEAGNTELAARTLAKRLDLNESQVRADLETGKLAAFEKTRLYRRVFELADATAKKRVPRAALPRIELRGAKLARSFTTERFARRVLERHRACMAATR